MAADDGFFPVSGGNVQVVARPEKRQFVVGRDVLLYGEERVQPGVDEYELVGFEKGYGSPQESGVLIGDDGPAVFFGVTAERRESAVLFPEFEGSAVDPVEH